ncbi:hypothetical protein NST66_28925 [Priestia sp. FSL W8-0524]|uniref:hypothetical protein n=1 Tax=Priestia sp. FSL W8-0524 TaxID=2954625 RepID=UPI0030F4B8D2
MILEEQKKLYIQHFKEWLKEQDVFQKKIERDIETNTELIELNEKQLELHIQRVNIGIKEHNKWAEDNGIEERIELIDECSLTEEEQRKIELETFVQTLKIIEQNFNIEIKPVDHGSVVIEDLTTNKQYWFRADEHKYWPEGEIIDPV